MFELVKPEIKKKLVNYLIPIFLFLIAFVWKFNFIGTRDICLDEPFTIFHAQRSVMDILKLPAQNEPNPPLFMLLLHFWMKIFGNSPTAIRTLPLIFNALTPIFLYLTGKKIENVWGGIIAAGLFIFSTYHFYFGLETRAYAMLSFATAMALYYFMLLVDNPTNKKIMVGLIIANSLMIYAHYFGWFVVFIQAVACILYINDKVFVKKILITEIATGILFIPMAIVFIKQFLKSKQGTWLTSPDKTEYLNQLKQFFNTSDVFILVGVIASISLIFILFNKPQSHKIKILIVICLWWIIPYSLMFFISLKIPMFINRYILFNTIGIYVFIAIIVASAFNEKKILLPILSLVIIIIMYLKIEINSKDFYYREVRNTVNYVNKIADTNCIIIIHPHWTSLGFSYYYDRSIFEDINHFETRLLSKSIFPVWDINNVTNIIATNKPSRIVYFQDGSIFNDGNNTIFKYLDSVYHRVDSVFYPQCFNVSKFELK